MANANSTPNPRLQTTLLRSLCETNQTHLENFIASLSCLSRLLPDPENQNIELASFVQMLIDHGNFVYDATHRDLQALESLTGEAA